MSYSYLKIIALVIFGLYNIQLSAQCPTTANTKSNGKDCLQLSFSGTPSPDPPTIPGYINVSGSGGGTYVYRATTQGNCNGGTWVGYSGTFTVNGTSCTYNSGVLPIELISWDAVLVQESCILSWTTTSEIDNEYFSIERSADGVNFNSIGTLAATNIATKQNHYSFIDKEPLNGLNYYRLKQVDFDGTSQGSDIIVVEHERDSETKIITYPNRLKIICNEKIERLEIFTFDGYLVKNIAETNQKEHDTSIINDGYYIVRLTTKTTVKSQKIYIN